ncbi:PepSY-associated TM helix domain-containing protein [Litchfieldella xinjiangensis]|uniref:PepSY-associated TM helix domain-containing protein n=1 Tax=Litchfieldella xinjiangensis TaxID=1166948 RepID=UPI0009DDF46A|nr:PepSY-associated TM helix domain-containing protein [Halomonas xinjiangensis]
MQCSFPRRRPSAAFSRRTGKRLLAFVSRLHFYIGLFVGPFLLVAALSGIVYVFAPQVESWLYHDALTSESQGVPQPLARQVEVAQDALGEAALPAAVRPAPHSGDTTRVMFAAPELGPSEHRALFVDPVTLEIKGDMTVYGTSGALPLRATIGQFHRSMLLGDVGRLYSELAASWLWIAALGGVALWLQRRRALRQVRGRQAMRRRHSTLGVIALVGLVFFSATGLTWSKWAGNNIAELRHAWGWATPGVSTHLAGEPSHGAGAHAEHGAAHAPMANTALTLFDFDRALQAARAAGIDATLLQIDPPAAADRAWRVSEIDRRWPTQVDQVALHPQSMAALDATDFTTFPLAAKLTRWGVDLHMGVLFGVPNQLVLAAFAAGLAVLVCWGYVMGWRRVRATSAGGPQTLTETVVLLPWSVRLAVLGVAIALGLALPVMGASLLLFAAIDMLRWAISRRQGLIAAGQP